MAQKFLLIFSFLLSGAKFSYNKIDRWYFGKILNNVAVVRLSWLSESLQGLCTTEHLLLKISICFVNCRNYVHRLSTSCSQSLRRKIWHFPTKIRLDSSWDIPTSEIHASYLDAWHIVLWWRSSGPRTWKFVNSPVNSQFERFCSNFSEWSFDEETRLFSSTCIRNDRTFKNHRRCL